MESLTLHVTARRYLMARYDELVDRYTELLGQERAGFGHQPEAWRIFPRYNVVAAILARVEQLDPDRLPALPRLVDELEKAATAQSAFTTPASSKVAAAAMAEERGLFSSAVRGWADRHDLQVAPLPYRRVLAPAESAARQQALHRRWGLDGRMWHPMIAAPMPPDVLVLAEASLWEEEPVEHVRAALRERGGGRVTELREYGEDYLFDVDLFAPRYTGAEGVWSDDTLSWIAYASHEGTVAFGGHLATALAAWPAIDRWR
ncbi:hypothetical protein [Amycolatopsis sp. CA-128772]|uniref:hypothetical protein n=1 Tax=Amycolatopsis sp. CA-128772 TaxID=2073159 RepID=UPI000CD2EABD|nr:hypothetical protein [Amycolatopsis sp. CA-128772]